MIKIIALLAGAVLGGVAVAADDAGRGEEPLWEWNLAAFGRLGPAYPASEENQFDFVPAPFPIYRGKVLRIGEDTENPFKGRVFQTDRVKLEMALDINFSSDSEDIAARQGMPDLDLLLELGPELEIKLNQREWLRGNWYFTPHIKGATSFDGFDPNFEGFIGSPEIQYRQKFLDDRARLKLKVTPVFASRDYMKYFYNVDSQFQTPTRPAYNASGGYLGTELGFSWRQSVSDTVTIVVGGQLSLHNGAANEDSPLFTDETTNSVFAAVLWKFWESKRRASTVEE